MLIQKGKTGKSTEKSWFYYDLSVIPYDVLLEVSVPTKFNGAYFIPQFRYYRLHTLRTYSH